MFRIISVASLLPQIRANLFLVWLLFRTFFLHLFVCNVLGGFFLSISVHDGWLVQGSYLLQDVRVHLFAFVWNLCTAKKYRVSKCSFFIWRPKVMFCFTAMIIAPLWCVYIHVCVRLGVCVCVKEKERWRWGSQALLWWDCIDRCVIAL